MLEIKQRKCSSNRYPVKQCSGLWHMQMPGISKHACLKPVCRLLLTNVGKSISVIRTWVWFLRVLLVPNWYMFLRNSTQFHSSKGSPKGIVTRDNLFVQAGNRKRNTFTGQENMWKLKSEFGGVFFCFFVVFFCFFSSFSSSFLQCPDENFASLRPWVFLKTFNNNGKPETLSFW